MKFSQEMVFPDTWTDEMCDLARAAARIEPRAQFKLGRMYQAGKLVPANVAEAVHWYQKAAESKDPNAAFMLGRIYARGEVVEHDSRKATRWYQFAAHLGNLQAMHALGNMYARGRGVPLDLEKAADWYLKAAKANDAGAQFVYGLMLRDARGVERNLIAAYAWIRRSIGGDMSRENRKIAEDARAALAERLPIDQLELAEALAVEPDFPETGGAVASRALAGGTQSRAEHAA